MIKKAEELYEERKYAEAMPLYSQLVSLYPKEAGYNLRYGVCLLHADRDKSAGLKFLKYAAGKDDSGPIAHYHYAEALHANYEFNKAISHYNKFKAEASNRELKDYQVDRKIEMCNNGKSLLTKVFDLNVVDKQEIGEKEFFRIYDLGEIGGKIIVKPDEFKSKTDEKLEKLSLIHLPEGALVIYYSGYGDSDSDGKDIFRVRKTGDGTWSDPENLGAPVNTPYDEDFPFMHPDGTLYFASKGHNSMGGYDLFKSVYNESTNTWSKPENLNFAISSAFDDILFISDIRNQLAYFASNRNTVDGKMNVYRVQISRKPMDAAFISGHFIAEGQKEVQSAKISVFDLENNEKVGTYYTNKNTGNYNIHLPESGTTYKFVIETDEDSPVHTGKVEVPEQSDLMSLKQEIRLVGDGDGEKLVIKNLFDESSRTEVDEDAMLSMLRSASDLEINATEAKVLSEEVEPEPEVGKEADLVKDLSIQSKFEVLISDMESLVGDLNEDLSTLRNDIAYSFHYSYEKATKADNLYDDVEIKRQEFINENEGERKKQLLDELMKLRGGLEPIASEAIVSYDFARSLANEYDEKLNDIDRMKSELSAAKSKSAPSNTEMESVLAQTGPLVQDLKSMRSVYEIEPQRYNDLLNSTNAKFEKEEKYYNELKRDLEGLYLEIERLDKEISDSRSKKAKEQLSEQKSAKEIDLEDLEYQISNVRKSYQNLKSEKRNLEADAKQLNAFIAGIKSNREKVKPLSTEENEELKKLINYFKEQRMIEDVIGEGMEPLLSGTAREQDLSVAHHYNATDNSGNQVDYDELYSVNLAAIELISDREEKNKQASDLYSNWARTIGEDRKIRENDLQFTDKKSDMVVLEEQIEILKEKEQKYLSLSEQYASEATALATTEKTKPSGGDDSVEKPMKIQKSPAGGEKVSPKPESVSSAPNMQAMLTAARPNTGTRNLDLQTIDNSFQSSIESIRVEGDDPVAHINLAVIELSWAKSIDQLIEQKEGALNEVKDPEEAQTLRQGISKLNEEKIRHEKAAASEFSDFEITDFQGHSGVDVDHNLKVSYDNESNPDFDYHSNYSEIQKSIEEDPFLTALEKSTKLAQLHSFWAQTIQDEIIHLNQELKSAGTEEDKSNIQAEIDKLQEQKLDQIKRSNRHYKAVKEALGTEVASSEGVGQPVALVPDQRKSTENGTPPPSTFADFQEDINAEAIEVENKISQKETSLEEVSSKSEKQQLALALALLKKEKADRESAQAELENKKDQELLSDEAKETFSEKNINFREEARDFVFTKKDFTASVPAGTSAHQEYNAALEHYSEVVSLEKRKQALVNSEVVDKEAKTAVLAIQDKIDEEKIGAYQKLVSSNRSSYNEQQRAIQQLLDANPNLKTENPKLWNRIRAANVIYEEVGKYQSEAENTRSNSLKFDIYDQAQFMAEYVLQEQLAILEELEKETSTEELAIISTTGVGENVIQKQAIEEFRINEGDMETILEKPAFVEYVKDRKAIADLSERRKELDALVITEKDELTKLREERDFLYETAANTKGGKRKKLIREAQVLNTRIESKEKSVDSLILLQVQNREQQQVIRQNTQRLFRDASVEERYKIVMLAEVRYQGLDQETYATTDEVEVKTFESEEPQQVESRQSEVASTDVSEEAASTQQPSASPVETASEDEYSTKLNESEFVEKAAVIPEELDGDLFVTTTSSRVSPYNTSRPIPVDEEIPTGLIFKVQVGAYRNPIPQDLFKGFAPLMGERIPNGITRYTAGLFRDFGNANRAKNEIRTLGYNDAFVVAFMDGKRIPFDELRNLGDVDLTVPASAEADITLPSRNVPNEVLNTPSTIRDRGQVSNAIAEQTVNTRDVTGMFFTVQVGVYSNTVLPERLQGIRDLNSELLDNGNIRYSAGQFNTLEQARSRESDVVSQGVDDAFITAYLDGNRISVGEAIRRLEENGP